MYSRLFWESQKPMLEVLQPLARIPEGCRKPGQGRREPLRCDTPSFSKAGGNLGLGRGAILPRSKGPFRLAVPWRTFRGLDRT